MSGSASTVKSQQTSEAMTSTRRSSVLVAAGILLSRISGLVRARVFAYYLGNSDAAGAFNAALRIPNFLQNLFGEGVLSASFIPIYSRLRHEMDESTARKMASVVGTVLALMVSFIVLLGVLFTPYFVDLVAPGFHGEVKELTITLVRILFPGVGLLVMSAWCLGILNSHRKFFLSYVAPVFWNLAMIATLLLYGRSSSQFDLAVAAAWGSVIGSALQFGVQLPFVFRYAGQVRPLLDLQLKPVRDAFRGVVPVLISRGVVQLSAYIDGMISSFLGASAVASLGYAQIIYLLPVSLFGMAVAVAELPEMSVAGGATELARQKLRERLIKGRRSIAFFVIPSAVAFLFVGRSVVAALYQSGKFSGEDSLYVWYILMGSVVGLLAATWGRLYSSAFYALGDTRTPLYFALIRVTLTVVLGLLFAFPLRFLIIEFFSSVPGLRLPEISGIELGLGAVGLTASAGLAGWIEFLCLRFALTKRIGSTGIDSRFLFKVWGSALVSALVALIFAHYLLDEGLLVLRFLHYNFTPLIVLGVYGVIYLGFAATLKIEEIGAVTKRLRRR
jgi:putative peptidoglycan lipid II flippase